MTVATNRPAEQYNTGSILSHIYHIFASYLFCKLLYSSLPNLGRSIFPDLFKYVNLLISLLFPPSCPFLLRVANCLKPIEFQISAHTLPLFLWPSLLQLIIKSLTFRKFRCERESFGCRVGFSHLQAS